MAVVTQEFSWGGWQGIQLSEGVWMSGREGQSGGLKIWICFVLYCLVFWGLFVCLFVFFAKEMVPTG